MALPILAIVGDAPCAVADATVERPEGIAAFDDRFHSDEADPPAASAERFVRHARKDTLRYNVRPDYTAFRVPVLAVDERCASRSRMPRRSVSA